MKTRVCPKCEGRLSYYRYPQQMFNSVVVGKDDEEWAVQNGSVQEWCYDQLSGVNHVQCTHCGAMWLPNGKRIHMDPSIVVARVMTLIHEGHFDFAKLEQLLDKSIRSPVGNSEMP